MEHIKKTLEGVIKDMEKSLSPQREEAAKLFRKNLAKGERQHVRCGALRDGVLTVNVDSSPWLYQLSLRKEEFVKKLGLKDIRFQIGKVK